MGKVGQQNIGALKRAFAHAGDVEVLGLRFTSDRLVPGDRWAVCASLWFQSYAAGVQAPVVLRATNIAALDLVPEDALVACAADAPDDPSALIDPS